MRLIAALAAVVIGGGAWIGTRPASHPAGEASAAVPVTVAAARRQDVPLYLEGLGNVQAFYTVTIRAQVDGQLRQIAFKEGQEVKGGDLLAQIDPRTYQAAVDQALAKKAQDEAQLANARNDLRRYAGLAEKNYVAHQQLDAARAQVNILEAAVQGDEAAVENARVMLGYTTIKSPIDGRAGIRQVDPGNIVHAGDTGGIVVITQMHPISVLFTLPEEALPKVVKAMAAGPVEVGAFSRDNKQRFDQGTLELVDNQIDPATGTVRLKATMPNGSDLLWPGQFVNARLRVGILRQVVTIPAKAIQRGPEGAFTFVTKADGTVDVRKITVGEVSQGLAVVESGLEAGDGVVTEGQYRLRPGTRVDARTEPAADGAGSAKPE